MNNQKKSLTKIVLWYLMCIGMIGRYTEKGIYLFLGFLICSFFVFLENRSVFLSLLRQKEIILATLLLIIILVVNLFVKDNGEVIYHNLVNLIFPIIIGFVLITICSKRREEIDFFLVASFWILNIWWILNLCLISVQNTGNPFLIKNQWLEDNSYYPDLCCGLFGYNGTHEFAFFSCSVLCISLYKMECMKDKWKRITLGTYLIALEAWSLSLSLKNDNKVLFVLLPAILCIYYVLRLKWAKFDIGRRLFKYSKYIMLFIVVIVILQSNPFIKKILNEQVFTKISRIVFYHKADSVYGGNERLEIINYAVRERSTWLIGKGIGSSAWIEVGAFGFGHYGLSSMGAFLVQMGIWFTTIYIILYSYMSSIMINRMDNTKMSRPRISIIIIFIISALAVYSPIFTSYTSSIWIFFCFCAFGGVQKELERRKNNGIKNDFYES